MGEETIRERLERGELTLLAPEAAKAARTRGRLRPGEAESDVRTCYQRDTDRIVHSKAFRRLMHKTQVFLKPEGDHYRTRMTHTLEVARIALRLNEDLTEAQALGHDLGHTPFGHAGEVALSDVMGVPFRHNEQSLRVVDRLEKDGDGLNLTYETRMGILGHTGEFVPETLEGRVVRLSDRIAYINHDIDDAVRAGILANGDIPRSISAVRRGRGHRPGAAGPQGHGRPAQLPLRARLPQPGGQGRGVEGQADPTGAVPLLHGAPGPAAGRLRPAAGLRRHLPHGLRLHCRHDG